MINDRIAFLIDTLEISVNRFSENINTNPTIIHNVIKGRRSKPSFKLLEKIVTKYERVSTEWLVKGTGSIWRRKSSVIRENLPKLQELETRIFDLVDQIKNLNPEAHQAYELYELVRHLIDENDTQQKKLVKSNDRQDEIIRTLMKLKKSF